VARSARADLVCGCERSVGPCSEGWSGISHDHDLRIQGEGCAPLEMLAANRRKAVPPMGVEEWRGGESRSDS
jgi:hypothetical protein